MTTSNPPLLKCARYWLSNVSSASARRDCPILSAVCRRNCDPGRSILGMRRKGARKRDETLDWNVFGAGRGVDARGFQQRRRIEPKRPQTLAQHFAALTECGFGHPFERAPFAGEG